MTIRHLKIFITVVDSGSMSAAAAKLYISQPTVSQAIAELERYYGILLFERLSQKLFITEYGIKLLSYARHIVESFDNMERDMKNDTNITSIHIGCSVSVGTFLINDILNKAESKQLNYEVSVTVNNTSTIEEKILSNQIDIGIIEGITNSSDLVLIPVFTDKLVLICGKNHPLAKQRKLSYKDLDGETLISREKGSYERNQFEKLAKEKHISFNRRWNCTNTEAIKCAVMNNRGIAVMSSMLTKREVNSGDIVLLDVEDLPIYRTIYLIHHKNKYITPCIQEIINICKEYET